MYRINFDEMSFEEIVQYCLMLEKEAEALYKALATDASDAAARIRFTALAEMERGHAQQLKEMDIERFFQTVPRDIPDLKITENMERIDPGKRLNALEALVLAAQREKVSLELYQALAQRYADEPLLLNFFTLMAEQEAAHKHDLESEYERRVQGEY